MQCPTCVETTVTAFCRECGKGVCGTCVQMIDGVPHCSDCAPAAEAAEEAAAQQEAEFQAAAASDAPMAAPPPPPLPGRTYNEDAPHPGLAAVLGIVPGLGAVYNGHYVKGLLHALIFGLLLAIASSTPVGPAFAPLIALFFLYMPIEAYRTAQAMRRGETVDEMSGLVGALFQSTSRSPIGGILVIALGVLMLLFTLEVFSIRDVAPYWPVLLIIFGVWRLYAAVRLRAQEGEAEEARRYERETY